MGAVTEIDRPWAPENSLRVNQRRGVQAEEKYASSMSKDLGGEADVEDPFAAPDRRVARVLTPATR